MPYVHISTTDKMDYEKKEQLFLKIANIMDTIPGKSYDNTTIQIDDSAYIRRGDLKDCLVMDIHLLYASPEDAKEAFCHKVTDIVESELGISRKGITINFTELDHWCSNDTYR